MPSSLWLVKRLGKPICPGVPKGIGFFVKRRCVPKSMLPGHGKSLKARRKDAKLQCSEVHWPLSRLGSLRRLGTLTNRNSHVNSKIASSHVDLLNKLNTPIQRNFNGTHVDQPWDFGGSVCQMCVPSLRSSNDLQHGLNRSTGMSNGRPFGLRHMGTPALQVRNRTRHRW